MNNGFDITLIPDKLREEINGRLQRIQRQMEDGAAILIAANVNIFYTTGRFFRGYVWLPKKGDALYFVMKPQIFKEEQGVYYIRKPEQIPDILNEKGLEAPLAVGIEEDILTYSDSCRLMNLFPKADFFNSTSLLRNVRMVKTPYELDLMRMDGMKQAQVYSKISSLYRKGMTDIQLQIAIEQELRDAGCLGFPRVAGNLMEINMGSVLAGDNADNPSPYEFAMGGAGIDPSLPGGADGTIIRKGETVMVDMNGSFNAYQTDMTRVWTLGELPEIAYKAHNCSIRILRELEKTARPGIEVCNLYFKAIEIAEEENLDEYFMGHRQKSMFIGHGVGIELNEQPPIAPKCKVILAERMTLAIEPKFVIPGTGAVGVENTYIVTSDGLECITPLDENIMEFYS